MPLQDAFVDIEIKRIKDLVGTAQVIGAVSGGVDSTIASVLMKAAIGDQYHAVLVNNGLMRLGECEQVKKDLRDGLGVDLYVAEKTELFLSRLAGVS